jgi:hypothetical protein
MVAASCQAMIIEADWWEANNEAERLAQAAADKDPAAGGFADVVAQLNTEAHQASDELHYHQLRNALSNACKTVRVTLP